MRETQTAWHPSDFLPVVDVQALLDGLESTNYSVTKLVARVENLRHRPTALIPYAIPGPKKYGWWITSSICEFIFYERHTVHVHQQHIISHELSHILLGHKTTTLDDDHARLLLASQSLSVITADPDLLMRELSGLHELEREAEAEALATLLQTELIRRVGLHTLTAQVATIPMWSEWAMGLGIDR
jgi:hypothetical protein